MLVFMLLILTIDCFLLFGVNESDAYGYFVHLLNVLTLPLQVFFLTRKTYGRASLHYLKHHYYTTFAITANRVFFYKFQKIVKRYEVMVVFLAPVIAIVALSPFSFDLVIQLLLNSTLFLILLMFSIIFLDFYKNFGGVLIQAIGFMYFGFIAFFEFTAHNIMVFTLLLISIFAVALYVIWSMKIK